MFISIVLKKKLKGSLTKTFALCISTVCFEEQKLGAYTLKCIILGGGPLPPWGSCSKNTLWLIGLTHGT